MNDSRVLLVILDGFGEAPPGHGNAITEAHMNFFEGLKKKYPWTLLEASGNAVGLPAGFQGNSEVGHFTLGAGRITYQTFEAINQSIQSGDFFKIPSLVEACEHVRTANARGEKRALHLLGMISDEGVHAHIHHLFALLELAKRHEAFPIFIHTILDGRDVPERSANQYLKQLQEKIHELGLDTPLKGLEGPPKASLASMIGRYYAMDRDDNWDRTQKAYDLIVHGKGSLSKNPEAALKQAYAEGAETDYYVPPFVFEPSGTLKSDDALIFFNFRTDRSRQLSEALLNKNFDQFPVTHAPINMVALGPYTTLAPVAFPAPIVKQNLGQVLSQHGISQLRLAETEKYAHVTYFLNSQIEAPEPGEERLLVDSPKCPSYAEKPEMSARELTNALIKAMDQDAAGSQKIRFIGMNYANADLVGHSGDYAAAIQCCQVLDECLARFIPKALEHGYDVFITGDHGNAEQMFYANGEPCPAHTTNPVIGLWVSARAEGKQLRQDGGLQDVAPTVLDLLHVEKPTEMTGESLLLLSENP